MVVKALAIGRQAGLRAGYGALDEMARQLQATQAELERLRSQYLLARRIIERSDQLLALRERDDKPTMH
jgi:hypothetical protein